MRIAVFIPVYSEPKRLAALCAALSLDSFPDKAIIVVVDGATTPAIASALGEIRGLPSVSIIDGVPHLGKAAALNRAALAVPAESFLFLDNDISLPRGSFSLAALDRELACADLVELPKYGLGSGPIAAMMKVEFVSSLGAADSMARSIGACPSMNGAAFAIRRGLFEELGGFGPVINEDMDLAARAFFAGASFAFPAALAVGNEVPPAPAAWIKQRRRWVVNNVVWGGRYLGPCLSSSPRIRQAAAKAAAWSLLPWMALLGGAACGAGAASLLGARGDLADAALVAGAAIALAAASDSYERRGREFGAAIDPWAFIAYTLVYAPVCWIANAVGAIRVAAKAVPDLGWKVAGAGAPSTARERRAARVKYAKNEDLEA